VAVRTVAVICTALAGCAESDSPAASGVGSLDDPNLIHAAGHAGGLKGDGSPQARQPSLTFNGGPMLQAPELHAVYWGGQVPPDTQTSVNAYLGALASSTIVPMLGQYDTANPKQFITQMQYAGSMIDAEAPAQTTITDQDIQVELTRLIDTGSVPANDGNRLYIMYFPPGATITTDWGTSCVEFCGYHGSFYRNGTNAFYAVIPDMTVDPCRSACAYDPTPINDVYIATSHEVTEATTDAGVGLTASGAASYAWIDPLTGNEIGDICAGLTFISDAGLMEQREWSNAAQGCVDRTPASPSAIAVTPGQATVPASGTVALQVSATGTASLTLATFSLPSNVTAAINPTQISGGQSATITLTSTTPFASSGEIGINAVDANGTVHLAYVTLTAQGLAPTVTSVAVSGQAAGTPATGPGAGGTSLVLTGTNLGAVRTVTFGGVPASAQAISASFDGTQLYVSTPGHAPGAVDVAVSAPDGQGATLAGSYTFTASPAPALASISAALGPSRGGRKLTLTGTDFAWPQVTFGGVPAAVTSSSATKLVVVAPAHFAGAVDIAVINGDGQSATLPSAYTFADIAPPLLSRLTTSAGAAAGGDYVTIELGDVVGTAPTVQFGGAPATVVSVGPTFISVRTPAHAAGKVDVAVTDSGQTATLPSAYAFQ
jgi:hypothetical protein